jgi:mannose-1-phosphate guanylyltransferase
MRAILLAAGLGTRLRPLTDTVPKCLVPIRGKPLLQIWLDQLSSSGIGPFLVNTHYMAEQVEEFVCSTPYASSVLLFHEEKLLGTAGTLLTNADFFGGEDGLLIHADNYTEADFRTFLRAHFNRPAECLMTMMTFRTDNPSSCGIVELDSGGVVIGFHEKVVKPPGNNANGAIYILSNELIQMLKTEMKPACDFSTEVIPKLINRIFTYQTNELFADIGTPDSYEFVQRAVK